MSSYVVLYRAFSDGSDISLQERNWIKQNKKKVIDVEVHRNTSSVSSLSEIKLFINDRNQTYKDITLLITEMNQIDEGDASRIHSDINDLINSGVKISILGSDIVYSKENSAHTIDLAWHMLELWEIRKRSSKKSNSATKIWNEKRKLIENGETPKLKSPAWFTYDDINKKYKLNEAAETVRLCFKTYLEAKSMSETARLLNKLGVDTLGSSKAWGQTTVRQVLVSKATYGLLEARTVEFDDFYPAAISKDTFYLTQSEIKRRTPNSREVTRVNLKTSNLLSKIAKCGVCGMNLILHGKKQTSATGKTLDYRYLNCSCRKYHDKKCPLPSFRYKFVEDIIIAMAGEMNKIPHQGESIEHLSYLKGDLYALNQTKILLEFRIGNLVDVIAELPSDIIKEKIRINSAELESIKSEINKKMQAMAVINKTGGRENTYKIISALSRKLDNDENRAEFIISLSKVIDVCNFNQDGSIYIKSIENEIHINQTKGDVSIKMPSSEITIYIS